MRHLLRRPSLALIVALLALVVALGVPSYAARLITGKDIKNGSVRMPDIAKSAVNSEKVKDGTLLPADFAVGTLSAGGVGAAGPAGPAGSQGAPGPAGKDGANGKDGAAAPTPITLSGSLPVFSFGTTVATVDGMEVRATCFNNESGVAALSVYAQEGLVGFGTGYGTTNNEVFIMRSEAHAPVTAFSMSLRAQPTLDVVARTVGSPRGYAQIKVHVYRDANTCSYSGLITPGA